MWLEHLPGTFQHHNETADSRPYIKRGKLAAPEEVGVWVPSCKAQLSRPKLPEAHPVSHPHPARSQGPGSSLPTHKTILHYISDCWSLRPWLPLERGVSGFPVGRPCSLGPSPRRNIPVLCHTSNQQTPETGAATPPPAIVPHCTCDL